MEGVRGGAAGRGGLYRMREKRTGKDGEDTRQRWRPCNENVSALRALVLSRLPEVRGERK